MLQLTKWGNEIPTSRLSLQLRRFYVSGLDHILVKIQIFVILLSN